MKDDESKNKILSDNPSFFGKKLYCIDRRCHNLRFYIKRHDTSVSIIFLLAYAILNILIVQKESNVYVSILVILMLTVIALERALIYLKMKLDRENLQKKEKEMKFDKEEYDVAVDTLKNEKRTLKIRNNILEKQKQYLIKSLKEKIDNLNTLEKKMERLKKK